MKYDVYTNSSISFYPNINLDITVMPLDENNKETDTQYCIRKTYPSHSQYTEESLLFTVCQIIITQRLYENAEKTDLDKVFSGIIDNRLVPYYLVMVKILNSESYQLRLIPVPEGSENNKSYFIEYLKSRNIKFDEENIRCIKFINGNQAVFDAYEFDTSFTAKYAIDVDDIIHQLDKDESMLHRSMQVTML